MNWSFNDVLQISWIFLSKMISELERPEPVFRGSREGMENTSGFDDDDSNPGKVSAHNEKHHNGDNI